MVPAASASWTQNTVIGSVDVREQVEQILDRRGS